MNIKVSVVVPVYNAENTLVRCLANLVNQTLDEIEIILVNDASSDQSLEIMEECRSQFKYRVRVIDSPINRGAGGARNLGIQEASGEYIGFVDSDDMVDNCMYEKLYRKAKESDYDIVDCGFYYEKEDTAIIYTSDELTGVLDNEKRKNLIVSGGYIWSKIFKRDFIKKDKRFEFREKAILEDSDFLTYAFATAGSIGNVKEILYKYTYEPQSLSNITSGKKYVDYVYYAMESVYGVVSGLDIYDNIKEAIEYEIIQLYSYGIIMCLSQTINQNENMSNQMHKLKDFRNSHISAGYHNRFVRDKIGEDDINIMLCNDESPEKLIAEIKNKKMYYRG